VRQQSPGRPRCRLRDIEVPRARTWKGEGTAQNGFAAQMLELLGPGSVRGRRQARECRFHLRLRFPQGQGNLRGLRYPSGFSCLLRSSQVCRGPQNARQVSGKGLFSRGAFPKTARINLGPYFDGGTPVASAQRLGCVRGVVCLKGEVHTPWCNRVP
jgi:hypothetical protein